MSSLYGRAVSPCGRALNSAKGSSASAVNALGRKSQVLFQTRSWSEAPCWHFHVFGEFKCGPRPLLKGSPGLGKETVGRLPSPDIVQLSTYARNALQHASGLPEPFQAQPGSTHTRGPSFRLGGGGDRSSKAHLPSGQSKTEEGGE